MLNKFIDNRFSKYYTTVIILLSFLILSVLSGFFLYHSHFVAMEWDLEFHWQRILEMKKSLLNGDFFSLVAVNYFHQSGSAVMAMYPKINLVPMVILSFFIKSQVVFFNVSFMIRNFFALLISYYSSYYFNKNKSSSFVFAVSYVLSDMGIYYYAGVSALGTLSVITYLPLVMFGFLSLIKKNKWIELTIGMSAILLSHVLSFGIVILFLFLLLIPNLKCFKNIIKIQSLLKAILVTIMITGIFWIPFIWISLNNKMIIPTSDSIEGNSFLTLATVSLNNVVSDYIGVLSIVGMLLGFLYYKRLDKFKKQLLWISVIFIYFASGLFPWSIASHTFISHIQFPSRLYIIPQVILCYIFSETFLMIAIVKLRRKFSVLFITILVILMQMGAQEFLVNSNSGRPELDSGYNYDVNYVLRNNKDFSNIIHSKSNSTDYYPMESVPVVNDISNGIITYDNKKVKTKKYGDGKYYFILKKDASNLTIPFLHYKGLTYQVKLDDKIVNSYSNDHSLISIKNIKKGKHVIKVMALKSWYDYLSYVLSSLGIIILLYSLIKEYWLKRKNE
ncbi:YfhO family protein [Apilactobacillus nanyangensis]|uniref:YfhO family protein n=1 Tax=Apilactobacillus nanyangensis TaxID=2799579 RepID=A0ABT0HYX5_9LACO|nr:YfhO family protein [Apilactobacillus nanyangensis]MCK8611909.1 YfhO family protein [Apilactobacillus nanyangensis]